MVLAHFLKFRCLLATIDHRLIRAWLLRACRPQLLRVDGCGSSVFSKFRDLVGESFDVTFHLKHLLDNCSFETEDTRMVLRP